MARVRTLADKNRVYILQKENFQKELIGLSTPEDVKH